MNMINIKNLNNLILQAFEISDEILDIIQNFSCPINKLLLTKNINEVIFFYYNCEKYDNNSTNEIIPFIKLIFPICRNNNINNTLKTIPFKGINDLEIFGFNDLEFLCNESLNNLEKLSFKISVNDLNFFNNIKFTQIKNILFCDNEPIINGFSSLKVFPSIKIITINIQQLKENKYKCYLKSTNPNFERNFIFNDLKFLKEPFLKNTYNIFISNQILDDKKNVEFFSFNEIVNSFPIFKNLKAKRLNVKYTNKFIYCEELSNFEMNFTFDEFNFIHHHFFNEIEGLSFSKIKFNDNIDIRKENFRNLKHLEIKDSIIESMKIFSVIENIRKSLIINSDSNICNSFLLEYFNDIMFRIRKITNEDKKIKINYCSPFNFDIYIDEIDKLKSFNGCNEICLNNMGLNDSQLNFLNNETLTELEILNLVGNKIINLNFLESINLKKLNKLNLTDNLITSGYEIINNKYKLESLEIKLKNNDPNTYHLKFGYSSSYYNYYTFDYFCDINKNLDILKDLNFGHFYKLNLSGIKLKNIDFILNDIIKNVSFLILDNNLIDDISIFEKIKYLETEISLKNNQIRKGLHVLTTDFFKCIQIGLDIIKTENEYKICANFFYPKRNIEFFVNDINEVNDILDCNNNFIKLLKKDTDESKLIENQLLLYVSNWIKEKFDIIFNLMEFFENKKAILNLIKERYYYRTFLDQDIYIANENRQLMENALIYIQAKIAYLSLIKNIDHTFIFKDLDQEEEDIIKSLSFLNITKLKLDGCKFNLNILTQFNLIELDLSESSVTDIKGICELSELRILNLSNNKKISNLYELKDAKFKNLIELYLSNCNIKDSENIKISEFKFYYLEILDLSNNEMRILRPSSDIFKNLQTLIFARNNSENESDLSELSKLNPKCQIVKSNNNFKYEFAKN